MLSAGAAQLLEKQVSASAEFGSIIAFQLVPLWMGHVHGGQVWDYSHPSGESGTKANLFLGAGSVQFLQKSLGNRLR